MPEDNKQDIAGQGETPADVTPPVETAGGDKGQKSAAELEAELSELRKQLKAVNKESAERRMKLNEFETAEAKRKEAELSETEKLNNKLKEANDKLSQTQQEFNSRLIKAEIRVQAAKLGFNDPDDATTPAILAAASVNDTGEVEGVADALAELAKAKPYLLGTSRPAAPDTGAGKGNAPAGGGVPLTAGEQAAIAAAQRSGFKVDPAKVAQRKAQARLVTSGAPD